MKLQEPEVVGSVIFTVLAQDDIKMEIWKL